MFNLNRRSLIVPLAGLLAAWRLKAQNQVTVVATTTMKPQLQVFRVQSQTHTLPLTPASNTRSMVWLNGLLMCPGDDYVLTGRTLTFVPKQAIGTNPIIQVTYWTL